MLSLCSTLGVFNLTSLRKNPANWSSLMKWYSPITFLSTFKFLCWLDESSLETSLEVCSLLTGCCLVIANNAVLFKPVHSCSFMNSLVQCSRNFIVSNSKLLTGWCLVIALSCSSAGLLCLAMVPVYDQINTCWVQSW